jgi:hypothetical protein
MFLKLHKQHQNPCEGLEAFVKNFGDLGVMKDIQEQHKDRQTRGNDPERDKTEGRSHFTPFP